MRRPVRNAWSTIRNLDETLACLALVPNSAGTPSHPELSMHKRTLFSLTVCSFLATSTSAQWFSNASSNLPATGSFTEGIAFGDIDHDGDWDAAIGDGGESGNDQNRIWINMAGDQAGTIGIFTDQTASRAPVVSDTTFDIDFADIDGDGDLDLHSSNDSSFTNQACRLWRNNGLGFFTDTTATAWVVMSSVTPSALLAGGGFIDWCANSEFVDLDQDGFPDLVHSSRGGVSSGTVPTRVFLNNGIGGFVEFNPPGFTLSGINILNGTPALWSEGVQATNTTNTTGTHSDIATSAMGIDLADMDLDFDDDLLLGALQEAPRIFANRFQENGSVLRFRDLTGMAFPPLYTTGSDNYEQEFGDLDGDGDVDVFGVNWPGLFEATYENPNGLSLTLFAAGTSLPSSGADENDAELCDFDGDGALDVFMAGFIGVNKVYEGTPAAIGLTLLPPSASGVNISTRSLVARACDVDNDGGYDVLTGEDSGQNEKLWNNLFFDAPLDTIAPYIPSLKPIQDRTAATAAVPALAHVYDNGPMRLLYAHDTRVEVSVNGCRLPDVPAATTGTQIALAKLPGNLSGSVGWRFVSTDEHGNTGMSALSSFTSSAPAPFAFGFGAGSPGTLGIPTVHALSVPFAGAKLYVAGKGAPAGTLSWLAVTTAAAPGAPLVLPGLCNVNVLGLTLTLKVGPSDAAGCSVVALSVPPSTPAGIQVFAQYFALDGLSGNLLSSSAGLRIVTQ
jgi:hypothetical protein